MIMTFPGRQKCSDEFFKNRGTWRTWFLHHIARWVAARKVVRRVWGVELSQRRVGVGWDQRCTIQPSFNTFATRVDL
jgi:hypothetical protein